jgi:hypothetical protein
LGEEALRRECDVLIRVGEYERRRMRYDAAFSLLTLFGMVWGGVGF